MRSGGLANTDEDPIFPRGFHLPVLINLHSRSSIDGLTIESLDQWLHRHHLPQSRRRRQATDHCIVTYGRIGLLFIDRSDGPDQRP